ncbi:MAG: type II toxin-antitoxin system RelB/DinJ family antitoxin, partial [Oscillospiraceae bacterium]|nr:type II toxin-antitoxin system RelB/DinJ family antitoxin [Oscillospiraceae bacterium]
DLFASLGISLSDAFNMFACQAVRDNGLPFRPTAEPYYSAELRKALAEVERGETVAFDSIAELMADLNSEDDDDN